MASHPAAERLLEAANQAREDAEAFVVRGEFDAAEILFQAVRDAEHVLRAATARIRQAIRPLSISGFGEVHDRMNDSTDSLMLTVEELAGKTPDVSERVTYDDDWAAFVGSHPELLKPPTFTDDELVDALRVAIESREREWSRGATDSSRIVRVLLPGTETLKGHKATPVVIRVGKMLARLAREGRVIRLRPKSGGGGSAWSLAGLEIGEWWLKGYRVVDEGGSHAG